ncbi:maltokinase N-terminal cap-like domain-containing protein [Streptomyces spiralis]
MTPVTGRAQPPVARLLMPARPPAQPPAARPPVAQGLTPAEGRPAGPGLLEPMLPALGPWLAGRRWFDARYAGAALTARAASVVGEEPPLLLHGVVTAHRPGGPPLHHQLLLGLRPHLPARLEPAAITCVPDGPWRGWRLYDALADGTLLGLLLRTLADGGSGPGPRLERAGRFPLPVGGVPRPLEAEQSNTTVAYGDRVLLKLFRRPEPGPHTEVDALRALTRQRCTHTPRLYGALHSDAPGAEGLVLGLVEEFLPDARDGWEEAVRQARACLDGSCRGVPATGGFTGYAHSLGRAVAEVHGSLAEAFGRTRLTAEDVAEEAARMTARLKEAAEEVPALGRYTGRLGTLFDDYARLAGRGCPVFAQRIHGDLHLGQALHTADGWRIVDFEGEPARPVAERARPQPVLKDVAGMLRSLDYAARTALAGPESGDLEGTSPAQRLRRLRRAHAWSVRNRRAFVSGYASAGRDDPDCHPVPLRAFEADKAVYETLYESRHRPHLLPVPLAAVHRLAGTAR